METAAIKCPRCGGTDVATRGKSKNGKQRYRCKAAECPCNGFLLEYEIKSRAPGSKAAEGVKCPVCGGTNISTHGKSENGKQRYRCKAAECPCNGFLLEYEIKSRAPGTKATAEVKCPACGGTNIGTHGKSENGKQQYICKDSKCPCKRFLLNYDNKGREPGADEKILALALKNNSIQYIAQSLGVSPKKVKKTLRKANASNSDENTMTNDSDTEQDFGTIKQAPEIAATKNIDFLSEDTSKKPMLAKEDTQQEPYEEEPIIRCPICGLAEVTKFSIRNGVQEYRCNNTQCPRKFFRLKYVLAGCEPGIDDLILAMAADNSSIRHIMDTLGISRKKVCNTLKIPKKPKTPQVKVNCPVCGEDNTRKLGLSKHGVQTYYCLNTDCPKNYFQLEYRRKTSNDNVKVKCPLCGEDKTSKIGLAINGTQIYICANSDCPQKHFQLEYRRKTSNDNVKAKCPMCGEDNTRKLGFDKNGNQKYICVNSDCPKKCFQLEYSRKTINDNDKAKCPVCGEHKTRKVGFTKNGTQIYICVNSDCPKKCFQLEYSRKSINDNDKAKCPLCGEHKTRKAGFTKFGTQIYICVNSDCPKKYFQLEYSRKTINNNDKAKCPVCGEHKTRKVGFTNGIQKCLCTNTDCPKKYFQTKYKNQSKQL